MCVFIDSCRRQITEWRERERGAHALHASTNPGEGKPDMVFAHSNILLFLNTKKIKRTDFTNGTGAVEEKKNEYQNNEANPFSIHAVVTLSRVAHFCLSCCLFCCCVQCLFYFVWGVSCLSQSVCVGDFEVPPFFFIILHAN